MKLANENGFSLLEVLIALAIVLTGVLGAAMLQWVSLRDNVGAVNASIAHALLQDAAERIKINTNQTQQFAAGASSGTNANCFGAGAGCDAAALAGHDAADWQAMIAATLPGGEGVVCRDLTPNDGDGAANAECTDDSTAPWTVKIWWWEISNKSQNADNSARAQSAKRRAVLLLGAVN